MTNKYSLAEVFNPLDWKTPEEFEQAKTQARLFEEDLRLNLTLNPMELSEKYNDFSPNTWLNFTTNIKVVSFKLRFLGLLQDNKYFKVKNNIEDKLEALALKPNITSEEAKQITALTKLFDSSKKEMGKKVEELLIKQESKDTFIFNNELDTPNSIQIIEDDSITDKKETLKGECYIIEILSKPNYEHAGFISTKNNYPTPSFGLVKVFQYDNQKLFFEELDKLKKKFTTYALLHHKIFLPKSFLEGDYELYTKD